MAARDLIERMGSKAPASSPSQVLSGGISEPPEHAPLGGSRQEALQRLQVGLTGLVLMILLVGLASIIGSQAEKAQEAAVPDAAPTTEPTAAAPQSDPLADAGVVPDIPAEPEPETILNDEAGPEQIAPDGTITVPDTAPVDIDGGPNRRRNPEAGNRDNAP
ncbi:MAG: hypothetical protein SXU28_06490 [Pseudomonadota bacterium]|nr:hypothetical protein [Pseudomonadota bacterium]